MLAWLKKWFAAKPVIEFQDKELGKFTLESQIWNGSLEYGGRPIRVYLGGSEIAPDAALLLGLKALCDRLEVVIQDGFEFIRLNEPEAPCG
ncbi:MAG: hypothetical protein QM796_20960 [Chthoniobacteraceae bacterium]